MEAFISAAVLPQTNTFNTPWLTQGRTNKCSGYCDSIRTDTESSSSFHRNRKGRWTAKLTHTDTSAINTSHAVKTSTSTGAQKVRIADPYMDTYSRTDTDVETPAKVLLEVHQMPLHLLPQHKTKVHDHGVKEGQEQARDTDTIWRSHPSRSSASSVLSYYSPTALHNRLVQIRNQHQHCNTRTTTAVLGEQDEKTVPFSVPMAAFDLDDTLITTRSGEISYYRKDDHDWKLAFPNVKNKLLQAHDMGYLIVIITNQAQIMGCHHSKRASRFKVVAEQFIREMGSAAEGMVLLAATQRDEHRKGNGNAMMDLLASISSNAYDQTLEHSFDKPNQPMVSISLRNSYYVGDAAGRPGDHNKTDAEFAIHCGIHFMTETGYFGL